MFLRIGRAALLLAWLFGATVNVAELGASFVEVLDFGAQAAVRLSGGKFRPNQQITYEATLTPGPGPQPTILVDIYTGCVLPGLNLVLSLVQMPDGVITAVVGPKPVPFLRNVPFITTVVQFAHVFTGFEPLGVYRPYAGVVRPGGTLFEVGEGSFSSEFDHLAFDLEAFQFYR
jgi:hypothetical protein